MDFKNIITDEDRQKLAEVYKRLDFEKRQYAAYKENLSNLWRVMKKAHLKTEEHIYEIDKTIKMLESFGVKNAT